MTSRRQRRLAAWLVLGWAMFWLVNVTQLCCSNLGTPQLIAEAFALPIASVAMVQTGHGGAAKFDGYCESVSGMPITVHNAAAPPGDRIDVSPDVAVSATPLPRRAGALAGHTRPLPPPPSFPHYLQYQRLLI
jgi:hypothetical protein